MVQNNHHYLTEGAAFGKYSTYQTWANMYNVQRFERWPFVRGQDRAGFLSDEGATLETLDYTIRIGSTPTFLYFDLYFNTAYAAHYVYIYNVCLIYTR